MKKKALAWLLSAAMVLSMMVPVYAGEVIIDPAADEVVVEQEVQMVGVKLLQMMRVQMLRRLKTIVIRL